MFIVNFNRWLTFANCDAESYIIFSLFSGRYIVIVSEPTPNSLVPPHFRLSRNPLDSLFLSSELKIHKRLTSKKEQQKSLAMSGILLVTENLESVLSIWLCSVQIRIGCFSNDELYAGGGFNLPEIEETIFDVFFLLDHLEMSI
ncbi:hypothetical protein AX774_g2748 [Zancudomyces culisetae]|uniref:Uncharacterized protein n=1 Tax=Zancudomyces culisetae TaxID=1213189 RepID=A0A1R1PS03_ZANCU|nr:hypothetical protein AX774_g2748 [Zancudomyces culisetae]|eukprot:OMH83734.1 hypothetical protein AX774_g2748 [Zancudomyces culisetae]